jgi:predicted XRE-type DNA-binding protein
MKFKVAFGSKPRRQHAPTDGADAAPTAPRPPGVVADRLARRLALAHHIENLIEAGKLTDYAHAARVLGVSRARLTQLMDLLLVPSDVQERVLLGQWSKGERALRKEIISHAFTDTPGRAAPMSGSALPETPNENDK